MTRRPIGSPPGTVFSKGERVEIHRYNTNEGPEFVRGTVERDYPETDPNILDQGVCITFDSGRWGRDALYTVRRLSLLEQIAEAAK